MSRAKNTFLKDFNVEQIRLLQTAERQLRCAAKNIWSATGVLWAGIEIEEDGRLVQINPVRPATLAANQVARYIAEIKEAQAPKKKA